jgi:hypothetical protein
MSYRTAVQPVPVGSTSLKTPVVDGQGMLLALDGRCVERLALPVAVNLCRDSPHRLDILISNPPKAATSLLGSFLMELERHGIDYRLTSSERELYEELVHYVHRFRHVSVILLDCLDHWDDQHHATLDSLRSEGYRVFSLLDHSDIDYSRATLLNLNAKVKA